MADSIMIGPWCGGMTSSNCVIKVSVPDNVSVHLLLSDSATSEGTPENPKKIAPASVLNYGKVTIATFIPRNLTHNSHYFYAIHSDDTVGAASKGRFKTFPKEGSAASFSFVCAGDAKNGSNHKVFDSILDEQPLFFVHLGDLHYADTDSEKIAKYLKNYGRVFNSKRQAELYKNIPINYAWDDHDFCGNASRGDARGRATAALAYRACVPHYTLAESNNDAAIYHAFTVGRVRFLILDTRSARSPDQKTILGTRQKKWLIDELRAAKDAFKLIVIQSSIPWIGKAETGNERWWNYPKERAEIGSFIENQNIKNVCMISADSHMLAIDDGTNNSATSAKREGIGSFPSLVASPLDRNNSKRGGTYSHGVYDSDRGQYMLFTIVDTGGEKVKVIWEGKSQPLSSTLVSYSFNSPR